MNENDKFGPDGSALLLYLADELPPTERGELTRRLAVDADLSAELRRLEQADAMLADGLARLDRDAPLEAREAAAARRAKMAIRQWQSRRLAPTLAPSLASPRRRRWVISSAAAAAVIALAVGISIDKGRSDRASALLQGHHRSVAPTSGASGVGTPTLEATAPAPASGPAQQDDDERLLAMGLSSHEVQDSATFDAAPLHDDSSESGPVFDVPLDAGQ